MPIYERAPDVVVAQMQLMLRRYHPELRDADVHVDVVMAKAKTDEQGQPLGPAIKKGGVVLAGYCRILNLKDRVMGRGDAEIVVDGDRWPEWSTAKQNALLDHELQHLELRVDAKGACVRDDAQRPLLKTRPHDWDFGWFDVIAERHGDDSFEREQAERVFTVSGQLLFPFAAGVSRPERAEKFLNSGKKPEGGGGIDTVTLTAKSPGKPDRTVTLTKETGRRLKSIAKELAGGSRSMPPG